MGATEDRVVEFIREFPTSSIPPAVMHHAKRCIMNYCGVAIFAAKDPAVDSLLDEFAEEGASPQAMVLGRGMRTSGQNAALANAFLGHFDDFDDTHMVNHIHPTSPIFPAHLAAAEMAGSSGEDLVAAYVVGAEVACRVGSVVEPARRPGSENWHPTSMFGVLGAAAGAGRLLGLDHQQMVFGLGIAGTQASGLRLSSGSMCKPLHAGKSAQNGLFSALVARRGFTASDRMLEAPRGIIGIQADGFDLGPLTEGLGEHWELDHVGFKPYSCGIVTHGVIDGALLLRERDGVTLENLERMQGITHQPSASLSWNRHPEKGMQGKFSYFYAMAVALLDGQVLPAQFTDERANAPDVHAACAKMELGADPKLTRDAARVIATMKDGRVLTAEIAHQTGSPANPMSDAQTEAKFRALAGEVLPADKLDRAAQDLWDLDKAPNVSVLLSALA